MPRSATVALLTCAIIALAPVGPAAATGDGLPSDPRPDSPAGTVYQIPLDSARGDAAPRSAPQPDGADPAPLPAADPSPIRSENNFGSSSRVPGLAARPSTRPPGAGTGGRDRGRARTGDGGPAPIAGAAAGAASAGDALPSRLVGASLLGLIALVGVGAGVVAARARRGA